MRASLGLLALAVSLGLVPAQDEQTRDQEEQERRYLERQTAGRAAREAERTVDAVPALASRADALIRDRDHRVAANEHHRVQTDDPRLDPKVAVELLEAFRFFFEAFWAGRAELRPLEQPAQVYLFYSFAKYGKLLDVDFARARTRPRGHYLTQSDLIALHTDADGRDGPANALIHEAAHRLLEQRLLAGLEPPWVGEGLATYFGMTLQDARGEFRAGAIGGKSARLIGGAPPGGRREASERIGRLRRLFGSNKPEEREALARVMRLRDPGTFYGGAVEQHYDLAWALAHYLLHGEDQRHAGAFVRYLSRAAEGEDEADALLGELGIDDAALTTAVRTHVRTLRAR